MSGGVPGQVQHGHRSPAEIDTSPSTTGRTSSCATRRSRRREQCGTRPPCPGAIPKPASSTSGSRTAPTSARWTKAGTSGKTWSPATWSSWPWLTQTNRPARCPTATGDLQRGVHEERAVGPETSRELLQGYRPAPGSRARSLRHTAVAGAEGTGLAGSGARTSGSPPARERRPSPRTVDSEKRQRYSFITRRAPGTRAGRPFPSRGPRTSTRRAPGLRSEPNRVSGRGRAARGGGRCGRLRAGHGAARCRGSACRDVVVLDARHPGAGSSALSVGMVETQYLSEPDIAVRAYGRRYYDAMEREHGLAFVRDGYLRTAHDAAEQRRLRGQRARPAGLRGRGRRGADALPEIARRWPQLVVDDLAGGLFGAVGRPHRRLRVLRPGRAARPGGRRARH